MLALAPEHWLHRDQVIETLWPELPYDAALANLHKAAHFARRAIGESDAVVVRRGRVALAPGVVVKTDVERFEAENDPALYGGSCCLKIAMPPGQRSRVSGPEARVLAVIADPWTVGGGGD